MRKKKIKARIGDSVKIISGKYKGEISVIKEVINSKNRVKVENVNMQTKHIKATQSEEKGSLTQIEGPIDYSNIKILKKNTK